MATHPKMKDKTEEGLEQWRSGKMRLYKALTEPAIPDYCKHDVPLEKFCADCVVRANADRLETIEKRLEVIEEGLYAVLKEHYKTLHYRATDDMPLSKYDKAEIQRLLPIIQALRDLVVTP